MNARDPAVERIRHPLRARLLQVRGVVALTPYLVRVTLHGAELEGFTSASFDDHVKLFFPEPGARFPLMPEIGPDGPPRRAADADGPRPIARDYTPRRFDPVRGELDIDFVMHGPGPAANWVARANRGDYLGIAGPRGSFVISPGFDWHLLIGDDTAMPAIGRRLEELPRGSRVIAVIEVAGLAGHLDFATEADLDLIWTHRSGRADSALETAVRRLHLPPGEGFVWAAGEGNAIRAIHQHLVEKHGIDTARIRASSYWKRKPR